MNKIKGSTIIIIAMYLTWIGYVLFQVWCRATYDIFLPSEVTIATAALFIGETVSLARLKITKERNKEIVETGSTDEPEIRGKHSNIFLNKLGITQTSEFEELITEINKESNEQLQNKTTVANSVNQLQRNPRVVTKEVK